MDVVVPTRCCQNRPGAAVSRTGWQGGVNPWLAPGSAANGSTGPFMRVLAALNWRPEPPKSRAGADTVLSALLVRPEGDA